MAIGQRLEAAPITTPVKPAISSATDISVCQKWFLAIFCFLKDAHVR
jgi:hypothetical protein